MFSSQPWDVEIGSNFKDMAVEFAKYNRVLFVNRALERKSLTNIKDPVVQARLASIRRGINEMVEVQTNLWVQNPRTIVESINFIPVAFVHDWINRINNRRIARQIRLGMKELNFQDAILINDNDFIRGLHMRQLLPVKDSIFYIRDFLLAVKFFMKHGKRLEPRAFQHYDMVVANSLYLANYARKWNTKSADIGQGCDVSAFLNLRSERPAELKTIPGPIVGYSGFIGKVRLDEGLIKYMAEQLPSCSFVLVGPEDDHFRDSELHTKANVFFLGPKEPSEVPAYINAFDICINPQLVNELTVGNYPRKVDEYLALGKPVVATATEAMEMFRNYVELCTSKEDYVSAIKAILAGGDLKNDVLCDSRRNFALTHTWENSIGRLGDFFHQFNSN